MKRILLLVGPKGSGKSTIGDLLQTELGIRFVRIEPLFLQVRAEIGASHPDYERRGYQAVLTCLADELTRHETLCIETTGASAHTAWLLAELGRIALVLPIQVQAELPQCVDRIHTRDTSIHIPVSDDQVERINALAATVEFPWAACIDNRGPLNRSAVLETFRPLLEHEH